MAGERISSSSAETAEQVSTAPVLIVHCLGLSKYADPE